jgi:hypothetical protein
MITADISLKDPKKPPKLTFPDRCVNCGKPKAKTWPVKLSTGAQKRGQMVQLEMDVPMCAEWRKKTGLPRPGALLYCRTAGVCDVLSCLLLSPEGTTA